MIERMTLPEEETSRYGTVSRILHWLIALLIFIMLFLGWTMDTIPKDWKLLWLGTHKSLGIIILTLAIIRLVWRLYNSPPPLPGEISLWERTVAKATHWSLYGFLFAMPLSGWATTSAKGKPIVFLGIMQLPDFVAADKAFGKWLEEVHGYLAYMLATTIFLHAAAALFHHFIKKDSVLMRMWPPFIHKEKP